MDWNKVLEFISNLWNNVFIKVLVSTLVFILLWWLSSVIVNKTKKRALKRGKTDKLITIVIFNCILWGIRIFLIIVYASVVGIDTAGLAALVASAGVAIGLAIQGSLSNLAGGIVLILTRPFKLDDYIEASGVSGTVEEIKIFHTNLVAPDNKVIMIPNGVLANDIITNYSRKELRRVDLEFSISYDDNVNNAINIIEEVCSSHNLVLKDPIPFVKESAQTANSVKIVARVWVKNEDYWTVHFDLKKDIHKALDDNNITIPYQQIDIHTK